MKLIENKIEKLEQKNDLLGIYEQIEQECSRHVAHSERMRGKQIIYQSPEMA